MTTMRFKTDLNCGSCVAAVRPLLDNEGAIREWDVDTGAPQKTLTVVGEGITADRVRSLVSRAGFHVLDQIDGPSDSPPADEPDDPTRPATFYPLGLIVAYLVGVVALVQVRAGELDWMQAMNDFMAGFFLIFSFFKLLDLRAFASAYAGYDLIAGRWRWYGLAYPFIELALGIAYLVEFRPVLTNLATVIVLGIGSVGVLRTLAARRQIRCACLGSVIKLPMTYVTAVEDLLMVGMALVMLAALA